MNLIVKTKANGIVLFDSTASKTHLVLSNELLPKTTKVDNCTHSYWIEKYYRSIHINIAELYELAEAIYRIDTDRRINWESQFYRLELLQRLIDIEMSKSNINEKSCLELFHNDNLYYNFRLNQLENNQSEVIGIIKTTRVLVDLFKIY